MRGHPKSLRFLCPTAALFGSVFGASCATAPAPAGGAAASDVAFAYVGTYTDGDARGIYRIRFDGRTGVMESAGLTPGIANPTFLALSPDGRFLYAASEIDNYGGEKAGAVYAYAIDAASGALSSLGAQSSRGGGPCHLVVDKAGKNVLVANYGGGSVAVLPIRSDGSLGPSTAFVQHTGASVDPRRQGAPHAHEIVLSDDQRFAFVADLGLDRILIYRFDASAGTLVANDPPFVAVAPGAGPRHFLFAPGERTAYAINELDSTITRFSYDAGAGSLAAAESVSTLPEGGVPGNSTAELQMRRDGKFLYGSNRGHDSIAAFAVDADSGRLTSLGQQSTGGKTPRNFVLDPSGRFLLAANQRTGNVVSFAVDPVSGRLTPTGHELRIPAAVCIQFVSPAHAP